MKKNQGFAPVLILLAVLGVLFVVGGAYYLGTKKETTPFPVVTNPNNIVGNDKDTHGCIGSAGYTWCAVKNKCLRTWEEKCEVTTTTNETANWKTYTYSGVSFKYPPNWTTKEDLYRTPAEEAAGLQFGVLGVNLLPPNGETVGIYVGEGRQEPLCTDPNSFTYCEDINVLLPVRTESKDSSVIAVAKKVFESESKTSGSGENPPTEVFKNQPGDIKSITINGSKKWILAVDLLTQNPNWVPGGNETFFINQNTKIRSLNVTSATKTFNCNGTNSNLFVDTATFISNMQKTSYKTAYFDINGTDINAIYQQCLP